MLSDVLTPGRDYLFFERVDCAHQSMITVLNRCAVVMTPNLIAVIPEDNETDTVTFVKTLLADDAVDIDKLENALRAVLAGGFNRWVFPLAELESLRATAGFFGTITLKVKRESPCKLYVRDKGGKAAAKAFLSNSHRLSPPARSNDQSPSTHCA